MQPPLVAPLLTLSLVAPASMAQAFEDPGPHLAGWQSVSFVSPPTIPGRVYYPATAAGEGAPAKPGDGYPLVALIHGQSFEPASYDLLSLHLASWGYVVCSVGPLPGALHAPPSAAKQARNMLAWMEAESADPASAFAGLASDAPWSAMGHSLGGAALQHLIPLEPKVRTLIALEPYYESSGVKVGYLDDFDGAFLAVGGSVDDVVPVGEHAIPMALNASSQGRSQVVQVVGADHYGALDTDTLSAGDPLPWVEQHRLHRKVVTAFLEAEVGGDENAYAAFLGDGAAGEALAPESMNVEPPLWALASAVSPGSLVAGVGGKAGEPAWIAFSPQPASIPSRAGLLGLDPAGLTLLFAGNLGPGGTAEALLRLPALAAGRTLHLQAVVVHPEGAIASRTAIYVAP